MIFPQQLAQFDFMGYLYRAQGNIRHVGVGLGLNDQMIVKAHMAGCDALLVHNAPENLEGLEYYKKIQQKLKKYDLSLYRVHLPMDFSENGLIADFCSILQLPSARPTRLQYNVHEIFGGVYLAKDNLTLDTLLLRIKRLNPKTIRIAGVRRKLVKRIAVTTGDGCKPEFLDQLKPDVFICGLLNQEAERLARDIGITIIEATSYATENEPLKIVFQLFKKKFSNLEFTFINIGDSVCIV